MTADDGLRQREGDQPLPIPNDRPSAHDQLIAQLVARRELGLRRYGSLLQPHNGRDTGRDLVEELLDGAVYAQTLATELADLRAFEQQVRAILGDLEDTAATTGGPVNAHTYANLLRAALARLAG